MYNKIKIIIKREKEYIIKDNNFILDKESNLYDIYIRINEMSDIWIGECNTVEELKEMISEDNIIKTIINACSSDEIEILFSILKMNSYRYEYAGKTKIANYV